MESNLVLTHRLEKGTHATPIDVVYESSSMDADPSVVQVTSSLRDTKNSGH